MDTKNIYKNKIENSVEQKKVETPVQNLDQPAPKPKKAEIANCYAVNIRKGKSTNAPRIRTVRVGMECEILRVMNEWAQVEFADQPGVVGYLPYKYLKEK